MSRQITQRVVSDQDEKAAFEARMIAEAGQGAVALWIANNSGSGYANERVNDNRFGWLACLECLSNQSQDASAQPADALVTAVRRFLEAVDTGADEDEVKRARHLLRQALPKA